MDARIITHPKAGDIKEEVLNTTNSFKNPFFEAALWIRGEMLDIAGMVNAMKGRQQVSLRQTNVREKKRDDEEEIQKLQTGTLSLRNFFKSKDSKQNDIVRL